MLIDSKAAIERAKSYFNEIFPGVKDLRLEEVESAGPNWQVTFSFARPDLTLFGSPFTNPHRDYKTVTIDGNSGEPTAVKIRVLS